ncbi:MAG: glycosyltransferase family 4 protein [Candidatus Aureabacteria bacterium]|nr:glycosyltransferase family 4 protein [Candidatus Auribacterota bacterium]
MKILVVTKRYTSAKDISREDVGRPYCLFAALADIGHDVTFLLADYKKREFQDGERGKITFKIRPLSPRRFFSFQGIIEKELSGGDFDLLIAEGDPLFALLAGGPCRRTGTPFVYDLMDNYETYDIYRIPLFRLLDRAQVRKADLVVCVTEALREKIRPWRSAGVCVVGNGVDTGQFQPMDKLACRRKLSLPESTPLIGYFGYIVDYKGIHTLLAAHDLLRREKFRAALLLAGDRHPSVLLPGEDVIYRGIVPQDEIPGYINACDAVVVPSPSNDYTEYCFPLKLLEGIACGVPVVSTALGPVRELLGDDYPWLVKPGDPHDLAMKIRSACQSGSAAALWELALRHRWLNMADALGKALAGLRRVR